MLKTKCQINKGLSLDTVLKISELKQEPAWMRAFRIKAYNYFINCPWPNWVPALDLNWDEFKYFKQVTDQVYDDWSNVPSCIQSNFKEVTRMTMPFSKAGGIATQYESQVVYQQLAPYFKEQGVIFVDTDTALKEYPQLFRKYFNKLVNYKENKLTSLNSCVWSGGSFIYVPPGVKLEYPLHGYCRLNSNNLGQFERTIIIVGKGAELNYIENCASSTKITNSLHTSIVEVYVEAQAKCRYTAIQNWGLSVSNLVIMRAEVATAGLMEWVDGNMGAGLNIKYPTSLLKGAYAKGNYITVSLADQNQTQDTGGRMLHLAPETKSNILAKSIVCNGGSATYRGLVKITETALNSCSSVKCDTVILDELSKSFALPTNILGNKTSILEQEATIAKIKEETLFYLMSRGLTEDQALELIILGFIDVFRQELPA